jgi:[ribosomal protein S5]-alanine N-acetyltransferase
MLNLNFDPFPLLATQRLQLRPLLLEDDKDIYEIKSNREMIKYLDRPPMKTIFEARQFIEKINNGIALNRWIYWAISLKGNKSLIGTICIWRISEEEKKGEVGFELLPAFQGMGIIQEALNCVIEFGFNVLGLVSLEGEVDPQNIKSVKVMEKAGFKLIDYLRETDSEEVVEGKTVIYELRIKN